MNYFGLTVNLKDDPKLIAEYIEYHRHVWPEVESELPASCWGAKDADFPAGPAHVYVRGSCG